MENLPKMTYDELCEALLIGEEFGFGYDGYEFEFFYGMQGGDDEKCYGYFWNGKKKVTEKICAHTQKEKWLHFVNTYIIDGKTIRQIFEEGLNY